MANARTLRPALAVLLSGCCLQAFSGASAPPPVPPPATALPPGVLLDADGHLEPTDARGGRAFVDRHDLPLTPGARVRITVTSSTFDPVLEVTPPRGAPLSNDDAGGDRTRSELEVVSAEGGALKIQVTSFHADARGTYHLHVEQLPAAPAEAPVAVLSARTHHDPGAQPYVAVAPALHAGDRQAGTLDPADARLVTGESADVYDVALEAGEVEVRLRSEAFDAYLMVRGPGGASWEDDDGGGGLDSLVRIPAAAAGAYQVFATSYRSGLAGPYTLEVQRAGGATSPVDAAGPERGESTIAGTLAPGDAQLSSGEYSDTHTFAWTAGTTVHLEARSSEFDSYLIVRPPSGPQQDNDDLAPGNLNAGLDYAVTQTGEHRVLVTSYRPGESGAYALVVGGPGALPVPADQGGVAPSSPPSMPRAPGGSRVWVLSVGISDYPGEQNDLPECANDAVKIAEALRSQGLTAPEREFLLTDGRATGAAIRTAMGQIAAQITPDDTFVFFYSGHGGQREGHSADPRELDGIDEYLFVHDGPLFDDDFGHLVDGVHARTSLVALDACFAGGFAKDVITRPDVVGLFSSEEDVTSAVAAQFHAGGYLSHFLRLGIQGEADANPPDRQLTVGELTHFVWQQYGRHASDVHMGDSYQQLVVDRGAVHAGQELWRVGR